MIEVQKLSKRYGDKLAVDGLSFVVQPGMATGFLAPNGAGKSTTTRMIAGLDAPTTGRVVVNGGDYRSGRPPMAELVVLLEAKAAHWGKFAVFTGVVFLTTLLASLVAFFVIPPLTLLLPASLTDHFVQDLPSNAGSVILGGGFGVAHPLAPWTGLAVMCGDAVARIGFATWRLRRVDA